MINKTNDLSGSLLGKMIREEKKYLKSLIAQGEGQRLDFKYHIADAGKIAKSLVAFANSGGGTLLIGVKDNGKVKGIASDEEIYMIETAADFYCKPRVNVVLGEKNYDDKTVLEVKIGDSPDKPHYAKEEDGKWRVYIRHEDKNLLANKIFIDVARRKVTGQTTRIYFNDKTEDILHYISERGEVTFREIMKHSGVDYHSLHKLLVDLVTVEIITFNIRPGRKYFTLPPE